jgi:peptidoglycan/LPS O-acetylase OafA/YrhL
MQTKLPSKADFRPDINGLRAWAVAMVVLYHFGVPGFGGGFIGVDVFFVISGFLMTGILIGNLEAQRFSLWQFYLARGKRIAPALIVLCAVLLLLGTVLLTSSDLIALGKHLRGSLGFYSNVVFWGESGYFDAESHSKWLLHTWSLSVEWQFYMVYPLIVWGCWRLHPGRFSLRVLLLLLFAASLLLSVLVTPAKPGAAFYLLPTRAWEMMAGGLIVLTESPHAKIRALLPEAGGLLIAMAVLMYDHSTPWPGAWALLPVMGSCMVIWGQGSWTQLNEMAPIQWLGDRSYSLYLWHWPVASMLHHLELKGHALAIAMGLLIALVLSDISFRLVEQPTRRWLRDMPGQLALTALVMPSTLVYAMAIVMQSHDGFPQRNSPDVERASRAAQDSHPKRQSCLALEGTMAKGCIHGGKQVRAVMLGDSHGNALISALTAALPGGSQGGVLEWTYAGCPSADGVQTVAGIYPQDHHCADFNQWVLSHLNTLPLDVPIVVTNRWTHYVQGYNEEGERSHLKPLIYFDQLYAQPNPMLEQAYQAAVTSFICKVAEKRRVYLVLPVPEMGVSVPRILARRLQQSELLGQSYHDITIPLAEYAHRHASSMNMLNHVAAQCHVKTLDPRPWVCDATRCYGSQDRQAFYFDDDHLNEVGNKRLLPMFKQVFDATSETK